MQIRSGFVAAAICLTLGVPPSLARAQQATAASRQSVVVVLAFDGFARRYLDQDSAPTFHTLAREGVLADAMIPSFPTLTFPNFYTLATGLYPAHTGIVNNRFWDPAFNATFVYTGAMAKEARWWGGEPIWATAQKQGLRSASMFWVGSEAPIGGIQPTIFVPFDKRIQFESRVVQILSWLSLPDSMRPQLIMGYFEEPDHTGHDFGPDAPETAAMVLRADSMLAMFVNGLRTRGLYDKVNLIVLADHGMARISPDRVLYLDDVIDSASVRVVGETSPVLTISARDGNDSALVRQLRKLPHLSVWPKDSIPARLHFCCNARITSVVAVTDDGWSITWRHAKPSKQQGAHGYDNADPNMRALFIAHGPAFKGGTTLPPFENVNVYSLIAALLGVTPAPNDGSLAPFASVLK
jgi:predicted AlkP superfamily pyrophosphatase or phosphodiesterase